MITETISDAAVQTLAGQLRGNLIQPADAADDEARHVYNGMHDRRPRLIVRPADAADVIATVAFAADSGLSFTGGCAWTSTSIWPTRRCISTRSASKWMPPSNWCADCRNRSQTDHFSPGLTR